MNGVRKPLVTAAILVFVGVFSVNPAWSAPGMLENNTCRSARARVQQSGKSFRRCMQTAGGGERAKEEFCKYYAQQKKANEGKLELCQYKAMNKS
jgi:hypothetical protein